MIVGHLKALLVDTVEKVEVEVVEQGWHDHLTYILDEGLPDTDALPTKEGHEAVWVSGLATGGQEVRALWVKPFWDELLWLDPLLRVVCKTLDHDIDIRVGQKIDIAAFHFFLHHDWCCLVNRRHHSY